MPRSDLKRSEARKHVLRAKNDDFPSKSHWNPLQIAYRMPIGNIGNFPKSRFRKHFRKWPCRWSWEVSSRFLAVHSIPKNCTEAILKFFSVRKEIWVGKWWFPMKTPISLSDLRSYFVCKGFCKFRQHECFGVLWVFRALPLLPLWSRCQNS